MSKEVAKQVETRWRGKKASRSRDMLSMLEDEYQALLNTTVAKLTEKNETLEDIMMAMKADNEATVAELHTKIEELEGKLTFCHIIVGKRLLGGTPSHKVDAPKLKKFKGARSTDVRCDGTEIETWEEFKKDFKAQFYLEYINKEAWAKLLQFSQQSTIRDRGLSKNWNVEGSKNSQKP
ncbi:hypothetical protein PVK06_031263 [Gossypium arboreum]|uniref:Uncharacterized protein n=1 Tax=Gossypium arboreum TaxID=29729 RepID=A0ABR0NQJ2_GOSAR|nr:hypothetical protein PVK06_031263 [Gossypium arboreum]